MVLQIIGFSCMLKPLQSLVSSGNTVVGKMMVLTYLHMCNYCQREAGRKRFCDFLFTTDLWFRRLRFALDMSLLDMSDIRYPIDISQLRRNYQNGETAKRLSYLLM